MAQTKTTMTPGVDEPRERAKARKITGYARLDTAPFVPALDSTPST